MAGSTRIASLAAALAILGGELIGSAVCRSGTRNAPTSMTLIRCASHCEMRRGLIVFGVAIVIGLLATRGLLLEIRALPSDQLASRGVCPG